MIVKGVGISVVIPLYNKDSTVLRALESVFTQNTDVDFEIIIVDDGSTDQGFQLLDQINDDRLRVIRQDNQGVSAARNRGIAASKKEFITFLDADDEWLPEYLSTLVAMISSYPNESVFATAYFLQYPDGVRVASNNVSAPGERSICVRDDFFYAAAVGSSIFTTGAVCIRRPVFDVVGHFPVGVRINEDLCVWVEIALKYKIVFCSEPLAIYHKSAVNSACDSVPARRSYMLYVDVIERAIANGVLSGKQAHYATMYVNTWAIRNAFKNVIFGDRSEASKIIAEIKPQNVSDYIGFLSIKCFSFLPRSLAVLTWRIGKLVKHSVR